MRFSVVTIVYNEQDYIEKTLLSVINQTYKQFEYIVIDGFSKDGTLQIIEKYKEYINVFVSEPDKGIYDAMNKGLAFATGEYIIFINGGDAFYNINVLSQVDEEINRNKIDYDFIYGNSVDNNSDGEIYYRPARSYKKSWYGMFASHQSMFYKVSLINKLNLTYDLDYKIAADYKFTVLYLKSISSALYINKYIALFRSGGISQNSRNEGLFEADMIRKKVLHYNLFTRYSIIGLLYLSRFISDYAKPIYRILRFN